MKDQAILRVQLAGAPPVRIQSARLAEPDTNRPGGFTIVDDYTASLDLDPLPNGKYGLEFELEGYPPLRFGVSIETDSSRWIAFETPTPNCATVSVQRAHAGQDGSSARVHMIHLALPPRHEAVVLVAGADLKGGTRYLKFANTWRDDLYCGRTDLGEIPNTPIPRGIYDYTIVSIFDFRTGYLEQQIKGSKGWHRMVWAMQGSVAPDIAHPKADDALDRRQKADSISILDVYRHIDRLGRARPGCLRQLHFFGHAYLRGPVLLNTSDNSPSGHRDPSDKDPRTKDVRPENIAQYSYLRDACSPDTLVKSWGCFGSQLSKRLWAVHRTETRDEVVKFEGEPYTSDDAIRELRRDTFPEAYMVALCRDLKVDGWALPPAAKSEYKTSRRYYYLCSPKRHYGPIIGWYERFFQCQRDLGGAIPYRSFL